MMVEGYKKFEDIIDFALDVKKSEIVAYHKLVVNDIMVVDAELFLDGV